MVATAFRQPVEAEGIRSEELSASVAERAGGIVKGAVRSLAHGGAKARHWFYRVPSPGVRYYSFED